MRTHRSILRTSTTLGVMLAGLLCWSAPALAAGAPEEPVTEAASALTASSATLNGELSPGASATAGYDFVYGPYGTCSEGVETTEPGAEATGKSIKVSTPVTGLEPSKEYTFCVVATHTEGETTESTLGQPLTFKTSAAPPAVDSESSSGVTPFEATLEAQINPNNQETTYSFQYATNEALTEATTLPGAEALGGEYGERRVSAATGAGLTPGTTYYYRVIAENTAGEKTEGAVEHFTTSPLEKPIIEGESVSGLSSTSAKLEAQVNPNYQETTCEFEYGTEASLASDTVVACPEALGSGGSAVGASVVLSELQPGVTYYYRVVAKNETGTSEGTIEHFTTLHTPAVTTAPAQSPTRTTATFSGTVNPAGAATSYYFAYVDQAGYEAAPASGAQDPYADGRETSQVAVGSSYEAQPAGPLIVGELSPGTTYHYAVVAINSVGTTIGPDQTFTTSAPTPPIASTGGAEGVTQLAASITATVNTQGLSTTWQFEFGPVPYAGTMTPATVSSSSGRTVAISTSFDNDLQSGTTYYYRVVASNQDGTSYGTEQSFTTGAFPAAIPPSAAAALLPYTPISVLDAREAKEDKTTPRKPLTRAQKLKKALKACGKKPKKQRAGCRRQARKRYGSRKKKMTEKK